MKKLLILITVVGLGIGTSLAWTEVSRENCPGKIVCPLDGSTVCKDLCPARE